MYTYIDVCVYTHTGRKADESDSRQADAVRCAAVVGEGEQTFVRLLHLLSAIFFGVGFRRDPMRYPYGAELLQSLLSIRLQSSDKSGSITM